ncbi:integrating conjugative element protein [Mergibacter septicus]|uniref:Integrating conjugative element protein n=1 Tax=Mergibacter septicus TaxID=221402 RepID=A0A8D4LMT1_9PAST|nr:TIGR03756 family integrating conjugative element protein [Mergibacter septicus]AWX14733.1 integrating conjugative element protein [Mergibacter septicus]QDJ13984.1 integrating conjugative element protein [Mergibacter septicus]UTU48567.1 TIGR03756 family integrating conjugative element protein [Mergibacter septicus]WMR95804.1 TIGR03756 family integrating conjugative element protein [Mergibacter septicus]
MKTLKRSCIAILLATTIGTSNATINTIKIMESSASRSCTEYQIIGVCYWLYCSVFGCVIKTSVKVKHYLPEQVVSSYNYNGDNPWKEVASFGRSINASNIVERYPQYSRQLKFKNVDIIGHPQGAITNLLSKLGYYCSSQSFPLKTHFLSGLDVIGWRMGIPESFYPEALIPGKREINKGGDLWGNIYPRTGAVTQIHDYKAAAVVAQRAADIISRTGQIHIYLPAAQKPKPSKGYWPPPPVDEQKKSSHKWQMLYPKMERTCSNFPDRTSANETYSDKLSQTGNYTWALWRPYKCCKRRGQTYLGSTDWSN